ncbi:MAG TPA: MFS transporter [Fimbriimonas sp.]|nr:MFS transporter [Fimbriimonas sp.]
MTPEGRLLSLYLGLTTSVNGFLQPFVPIYLLEAGLTKSQIGLVAGSGAAMALLIQPLLGKLSDHVDARRPFVALMSVLACLAYMSFPFLHGAPAFLFAVALGANASLYLQGVGGVLVGRLAQKGRGGATYAAYRVWGSIAYVFVAIAVGLILKPKGGHGRTPLDLMFETGPLIFLGIAALAYWLPDPRRPVEAEEHTNKKVLISPNLRRFLAVDCLYIISLYGATNFISIFMQHLGGTGLFLSCVFLPGVISEALVMRISGAYSDHYGRRPVLAVSYVLLPFRLLLYSVATSPWWVLGAQSLHGFNFGIVGAVAIAFVNDQADHRTRGALQGQLSLVTAAAGAIGPSLMGFISDKYGLPAMFQVAAGLAFVATVIFILFVNESNEHAQGTGIKLLDSAPFPALSQSL